MSRIGSATKSKEFTQLVSTCLKLIRDKVRESSYYIFILVIRRGRDALVSEALKINAAL